MGETYYTCKKEGILVKIHKELLQIDEKMAFKWAVLNTSQKSPNGSLPYEKTDSLAIRKMKTLTAAAGHRTLTTRATIVMFDCFDVAVRFSPAEGVHAFEQANGPTNRSNGNIMVQELRESISH